MLQIKTRASTKEYKNARRNTKQICRRNQKQFEENLLYELEDKFGQYESRKCTEGICNSRWDFNQDLTYTDSNENLVTGEQQVLLHVG
jgi:hypothetical protein